MSFRASAKRSAPPWSNTTDVDRISFTGSTDTARIIGQAAARTHHRRELRARRQVALHRAATTPISTAAARTVAGPVHQCRSGLPRRHPHPRRGVDRRRVFWRACARRSPRMQSRRSARRRHEDRPADPPRALPARQRLRRARLCQDGVKPLWGGERHEFRRSVFSADHAHRRPPARPEMFQQRGVRAGADLADLPATRKS